MFTVLAILALAILVFVHELGHFLAARWQGIKVHSFSIGFGPILWRYQGAEVLYCLRAVPLGGFVGFPDDGDDPDRNLLANRPILDRALVMVAGVVTNFIFAYLLLVILTTIAGTEVLDQPGLAVKGFTYPGAPAEVAGIRPGDIILAVDQQELGNSDVIINQFQQDVISHADREMRLNISRQGRSIDVLVKPTGSPPKIGILLDYAGNFVRQPYHNPLEIFQSATGEFIHIFAITFQGLASLVTNFNQTSAQLAGPVAIVAVGSRLARENWTELLNFAAIISINLGIMNLLPLPALDGGQLLFLLLEALRGGNPLPRKLQDNVMQGGLVVLLSFGVLLIFKDSYRLIQDYLENNL
ncbi:MAG: RIP metalloprotease RseP [Cyanobacteria bacterium KgW148]|nr:RIP metalloprotease RseP [Cyanobacteria bacterium KgW148]